MTPAGSMFGPKSEFDPFLGAPVGQEKSGMFFSVVSALARLDLDPWREAATLTELPTKDAALRLTSLLSSLPSDATILLTLSTVNRLILLLPQETPRDRRTRERWLGVTTSYWIVGVYFVMAFVLMFAGRFAEDHRTQVATVGSLVAYRSEAGPSRETETNPIGVRDVRTTIEKRLDSAGAP